MSHSGAVGLGLFLFCLVFGVVLFVLWAIDRCQSPERLIAPRDTTKFWEDQMIEAHLKLVEAETQLRRIHGKEVTS